MISLKINGRPYSVQAPDDMPLLWVLRDLLNLKGTKFGCGIAQQAWLELEVVQCGYCQIMSAAALIERNPAPDDAEIDAAMAGNICRCATYARIRAAIKSASRT